MIIFSLQPTPTLFPLYPRSQALSLIDHDTTQKEQEIFILYNYMELKLSLSESY